MLEIWSVVPSSKIMTKLVRTFLLSTYILLIIRKVAGTKPEEILFVRSAENASNTNSLNNDTITRFSLKQNKELNITVQYSSNETSFELNTNLTLPSPTFNNMQVHENTASEQTTNNNNSTVKYFESLKRKNLNLFYKPIPPRINIRYARSAQKNRNKQPISQSELQPEGYIYDINHCQYIDDRVLCGYDKNPEEPKKKDIIDLDDLCRKHGDRIECGYVTGPYPDAYNPDPEKDKIAKISLANYNYIARSGPVIDVNDTNDYGAALRMGNVPNALQTEIVRLRNEISKLVAALPSNTNLTSGANSISITTPITIPTPSMSIASSITESANKKPEPNLSLSETLNLGSDVSKLTLSGLMTTKFTTPEHFENKRPEKKCVEREGRIFCRTVLI